MHRVIYEELCRGTILDHSRAEFRRIIAGLVEQGAEAVMLGCTELSLLVSVQDATVALFDTTRLHARCAAEWAMADVAPTLLTGGRSRSVDRPPARTSV